MSRPLYCELSAGGRAVRLNGSGGPSADGLVVTAEGVEGWLSTPDMKTGITERGVGDGAHDIPESSIAYSCRTVTLHCAAIGTDRGATLEAMDSLLWFAHRATRIRYVDADSDTYAEGMVQVATRPDWYERAIVTDLTIVCPRPERLSWRVRSATLVPLLGNSGGLSYGDAGQGLVYPLDYGVGMPVQNQCVLTNNGSSPAFPVFTVQGPFSGPVRLVFSGSRSGEVGFEGNGERGAFVLDSRSRTMSMNGSDVSRRLSSRGFVSVPPGGSVTVTLLAAGDGWCRVEWRDTWM